MIERLGTVLGRWCMTLAAFAAIAPDSRAQCGTSVVWHEGGAVEALTTGPSERLYLGERRQVRIVSVADPANPVELGRLIVDDVPRQLELDGNYLYVLLYDGGVRILDVTDPGAPTEVASITGLEPNSIATANDKLYVSVADSGAGFVRIYGVANPASPSLIAAYISPYGDPVAVEAKGNTAFFAYSNDVEAVDCSNAALPSLLGTYSIGGADSITAIVVRQGLMGVARGSGRTDIVDITTPASMTRRSFVNSASSGQTPLEMAEYGGVPYLYYFGPLGNLSCATLANPAQPVLNQNVRSYTVQIWNGIAARAGRLWVGENFRLACYDMTTPATPSVLRDAENPLNGVISLLAFGDHLVAWAGDALHVYDASAVASATEVATVALPATSLYPDACAEGNRGYFLNLTRLKKYDFTLPEAPVYLGEHMLAAPGEKVLVKDGLAYVADWGDLYIYDTLASGSSPPVGHAFTSVRPDRLCVDGGYAYVIDQGGGDFGDPAISVIDVRNPAAPVPVGDLRPRANQRLVDAVVRGNHAYIAQTDDLLEVYDVTNPASPVLRDSRSSTDMDRLAFAHNLLVVGDVSYVLRYFDVANPGTLAPMNAQTGSEVSLVANCVRGQWLWTGGFADGVNAVRLPGKPLIEEAPQDQPACPQGTTEFRVRLGNPVAGQTFQWRRNLIPLGDGTNANGTIISGTSTNTLRLESPAVADNGSFDCVVTNSCGTTTTSAAGMYPVVAPTILQHPHDEQVCEDGSVTLSVAWVGTLPATFQWQSVFPPGSGLWTNLSDSVLARFSISGSQTRFLTLAAAPGQTLPAGIIETSYRCVISNVCTSTTSNAGVLTVVSCTPPCDADYNQDGNADQDDVAYLVNVIAGGPNPSGRDPDFTGDGNADQDDYAALVNVIAGGPCP